MKELTEIIEHLQFINNDVVRKDNLLNKYQNLFKIVDKFINDEQFVESDSYYIFKTNYINDFIKIYEDIKNFGIINCQPQIVVQFKKPVKSSINTNTNTNNTNNNTNNNNEDNYLTKNMIVNTYDPYAPMSANNFPKLKFKKPNKKINCYLLNIDDNKYLFDPVSKKIYSSNDNMNKTIVGFIENDTIKINNKEYKLDTISDINYLQNIKYSKITEDHIIIDKKNNTSIINPDKKDEKIHINVNNDNDNNKFTNKLNNPLIKEENKYDRYVDLSLKTNKQSNSNDNEIYDKGICLI